MALIRTKNVGLVVLHRPTWLEDLANEHVEGFCVGAPWNSVAVDLGIRVSSCTFVSDVLACAAEKVLAVRGAWAQENPGTLAALVRAHGRAANFMRSVPTATRSARYLPRADQRVAGVVRSLDGRLKVAPQRNNADDAVCASAGPAPRGLIRCTRSCAVAPGSGEPSEHLAAAQAVFRPDVYDMILGASARHCLQVNLDRVGRVTGPPLDPAKVAR